MDHRLHEKCSAGCKRQENGFPVRSTYASIALDKQSNLNCGAKLFSLYNDNLMLTSVENCDYFAHIHAINIFQI
jgi:hypothetical protein